MVKFVIKKEDMDRINYKTFILSLTIILSVNLKAQEYKNYAILFNDDKEDLLDQVVFSTYEYSTTIGTLVCAAVENGKKKKGVKGKVIPTEHVKKAYFDNKTYIAIPQKNMKRSELCHIIAFSEKDILVVSDYGNNINVWVIDRITNKVKTRQYALRNRGKEKDIDYNLKYFKKAIEGSFKDYPELIKKLTKNLKEAKPLDDGFDYYKCGNSSDLYDSLQDKYEILGKDKSTQRKDSYERAF